MRSLATLVTTCALTMSGLVLSPANAVVDGDIPCVTDGSVTGSGTFTIFENVVTGHDNCTGAAVIPEGATSIGDSAFYYATSLTSITIPASVTSIGSGAFERATSLTSITIPASVTSIGNSAFERATSLTSITIPASVTSIGNSAFYGATSLDSITVDGANPSYSSTSGVLFNKNSTTLIAYPTGKDNTSYAIPTSVTSIGNSAFRNATSLASITIPAGVTSIGDAAFYDATSLASINIPANVTSIGDSAFSSATSLTSINIPANVTSIGDSAFEDATSLTSVTFAPGSQLISIGYSTFYNATSLTSINIPESVTSIGGFAFSSATSLTSIVIPASVTSIGGFAFSSATSLTSIVIPASVTSIGSSAFYEATMLNSVYFLGNAPTIGDSAFGSVASGAKAFIRSDATDFANVGVDWNGLVVEVGVYTVSYNTNGGSTIAAQAYARSIAAPAPPTRSGYTFAGWATTTTGTKISFPYRPVVTGDVTLYAKWTRNPVKAVATVKPKVSGTAKVGKKLTAKRGTWTGYPTPTYSYQWYACSKSVTSVKSKVPSTCKKISGATKSTIKLKSSQKKKYIAVLVTGTSKGTTKVAWLSKSTKKVK